MSPAAPLLLAFALGQEWTQWRGPNRDGVVPVAQAPASWPKDLKAKWKVAAGSGYSSPVVSQGFAYVFAREGEQETATKYALVTGHVEWRKSYGAPFQKNSYAKDMSKGPFSTPLLRDGKLYTLGITAILTSWDTKSGSVIWRRDFSPSVATSKLFTGSAMSPILDSGLLIVHTGDDRGSSVQALDPSSGNVKWSLKMTSGPAYASPIAVDGQLVTMTSQELVGISIASGKLLWMLPWKDEWLENIITPTRVGDLIVFSGVRRGTIALRLQKAGPPQQVWANADVAFYMSSPVVDGGYLYGLGSRKKGQFVCLDTKTGKTIWATNGREAFNAAVLNAGAHLVWMTNEGDLIVSRKSANSFEHVSRYSVSDAPVWTQPVLLGRQILIKSDNALALWSLD